LVLTGALAAGLSLPLVPAASADPPPWAGVWRNHGDYDRDDDYRDRHEDWHRRNDGYRRSGRGSYDDYGARCSPIVERMRTDRDKINEIAPTGRHKKALQWYKEDLENARRDMANCRNQASYEPNDSYDDSYGRYGGYDPYGSSDGSFDFKRDWPLLLGGFLNPQQ
jgi:hypothetical protein